MFHYYFLPLNPNQTCKSSKLEKARKDLQKAVNTVLEKKFALAYSGTQSSLDSRTINFLDEVLGLSNNKVQAPKERIGEVKKYQYHKLFALYNEDHPPQNERSIVAKLRCKHCGNPLQQEWKELFKLASNYEFRKGEKIKLWCVNCQQFNNPNELTDEPYFTTFYLSLIINNELPTSTLNDLLKTSSSQLGFPLKVQTHYY